VFRCSFPRQLIPLFPCCLLCLSFRVHLHALSCPLDCLESATGTSWELATFNSTDVEPLFQMDMTATNLPHIFLFTAAIKKKIPRKIGLELRRSVSRIGEKKVVKYRIFPHEIPAGKARNKLPEKFEEHGRYFTLSFSAGKWQRVPMGKISGNLKQRRNKSTEMSGPLSRGKMWSLSGGKNPR
jgi:hypothetical protein